MCASFAFFARAFGRDFPRREEEGVAAGERLWKRGKVTTDDLVEGRVMTSGKASGSFTSSALTVSCAPHVVTALCRFVFLSSLQTSGCWVGRRARAAAAHEAAPGIDVYCVRCVRSLVHVAGTSHGNLAKFLW